MTSTNNQRQETNGSPVDLNNRGADLILQGRHFEALLCFEASLKITKAWLAREEQKKRTWRSYRRASSGTSTEHPGQQRKVLGSALRIFPSSKAQSPRVTSSDERATGQETASNASLPGQMEGLPHAATSSKEQQESINKSDDNLSPGAHTKESKRSTPKAPPHPIPSYIFTDPIFLHDQPPHACRCHRECLMRLATVTLFNMAIAHHFMGNTLLKHCHTSPVLKTDHETRKDFENDAITDLQRAIALYTLSCRIQILENVILDDLVVLAHFNNLGQIHAMIGNIKASTVLFERLLSNLVLCTERIRNKEDRARARLRFAVLYRNTAQLILRSPAVAPAA